VSQSPTKSVSFSACDDNNFATAFDVPSQSDSGKPELQDTGGISPMLGSTDGWRVGRMLGLEDPRNDGMDDGFSAATSDETLVGPAEASTDGTAEETRVGELDGLLLGFEESTTVGTSEGGRVGVIDGLLLGAEEAFSDGSSEGTGVTGALVNRVGSFTQ
jgi:hypothetical protein